MKSIKLKLIVMYLSLVLIVMIMSGTFILTSIKNNEIKKAESQMEVYAQKIEEQVVSSYEEADYQRMLKQFTRTSSQGSSINGNILSEDGTTIASTAYENPPFPLYKDSVIISAMAKEAAFGSFKEGTQASAKEWICYAKPYIISGEVKYIIYTQMDSSPINESMSQTTKTILISVALALLLTTVTGYVFAKTLTDPITVLTARAKELAAGKQGQKLKVHSDDEIGQLTDSFNYMSSELSRSISEISKEKNKFEIIIHNMTDGIISFGREGELLHVNSVALEMLDLSEMNMTFPQFVKEFDLNSRLLTDIDTKNLKHEVLLIKGSYIKASCSPYVDEKGRVEGIVMVLQDITEERKLDEMRKEFVANVSHELRTPLTTVKSYTETLMEGTINDRETAAEFLSIINGEADRMTFLVNDLLQLSRFDNKQVVLNRSEIKINSFLEGCVRQSRILAENKRQTLNFEPYPGDIRIYADKDRISQVVNNLLSNAVKYSLSGASISIYITEDESYYKINVKDTGIGIKREDMPRIFERFYRVDKARSRAMGGTGLGLAIAREIMEYHDGKLTAESEYGKGSTMTMWFLKEAGANVNQT